MVPNVESVVLLPRIALSIRVGMMTPSTLITHSSFLQSTSKRQNEHAIDKSGKRVPHGPQ